MPDTAGSEASQFVGAFSYDPADFVTLTNVVSTDQGTAFPEQGTVRFASTGNGAIAAQTADGCRWTFAVRGNTAELEPATQSCELDGDHTVSFQYWAVVTDDGQHLSAFRAGSTTANGQPTSQYMFIGSLTRVE